MFLEIKTIDAARPLLPYRALMIDLHICLLILVWQMFIDLEIIPTT
jgi:hypothetical protein